MNIMATTKRPATIIDGEQFRQDYLVMSQVDLKAKYGITSAKMMKLIREHVPPDQRYANRIREGYVVISEEKALTV